MDERVPVNGRACPPLLLLLETTEKYHLCRHRPQRRSSNTHPHIYHHHDNHHDDDDQHHHCRSDDTMIMSTTRTTARRRTLRLVTSSMLPSVALFLFLSILINIPINSVLTIPAPQTSHRHVKEVFTTYACEGSEMRLNCPADSAIHLVRANYGRFSISICNDGGRFDWSVNCMSYRSFLIMQDRCSKNSNCSVVVSSSLFGDPCPGTQKYLEVQYHCKKPEPPQGPRPSQSLLPSSSSSSSAATTSPSSAASSGAAAASGEVALATTARTPLESAGNEDAAAAAGNSNSDLPPNQFGLFVPRFVPRPGPQDPSDLSRSPPLIARRPYSGGGGGLRFPSSSNQDSDSNYWPPPAVTRLPSSPMRPGPPSEAGMDFSPDTSITGLSGGGGVDLMEANNAVGLPGDYSDGNSDDQFNYDNPYGGGEALDERGQPLRPVYPTHGGGGRGGGGRGGGGYNRHNAISTVPSTPSTATSESSSSATTVIPFMFYILFGPAVLILVLSFVLAKCHAAASKSTGITSQLTGTAASSASSSSSSSNHQTDLHAHHAHHHAHHHLHHNLNIHPNSVHGGQSAMMRWAESLIGRWRRHRPGRGGMMSDGVCGTMSGTGATVVGGHHHHHHHHHVGDHAGQLPTKLIGLTAGPPTAGVGSMRYATGIGGGGGGQNHPSENWAYGIRPLVPPPISLDGKSSGSTTTGPLIPSYGIHTSSTETTNATTAASVSSSSGGSSGLSGKLVCPLTPTMRDDLLSNANQQNRTTGPLLVNPIKDLNSDQDSTSDMNNESASSTNSNNLPQSATAAATPHGLTIDEIASATADSRSLADFEARLQQIRTTGSLMRHAAAAGGFTTTSGRGGQAANINNFNVTRTPLVLSAADRRRPLLSTNPMWDAYGYGFNSSLVRAVNDGHHHHPHPHHHLVGHHPAASAAAVAAAASHAAAVNSYIDHIYMSIDKDSSNSNIYSATRI